MLIRTDISKCPVCICADSHNWEYGLCQGHQGSPGSTLSDPLYNLTEWDNNRFWAFWLRSSVEPRQHGWGFPSLLFLLPNHWPTSAEWIYDLPTFPLLPTCLFISQLGPLLLGCHRSISYHFPGTSFTQCIRAFHKGVSEHISPLPIP